MIATSPLLTKSNGILLPESSHPVTPVSSFIFVKPNGTYSSSSSYASTMKTSSISSSATVSNGANSPLSSFVVPTTSSPPTITSPMSLRPPTGSPSPPSPTTLAEPEYLPQGVLNDNRIEDSLAFDAANAPHFNVVLDGDVEAEPELIEDTFPWPESLVDWRWTHGVIPFHIHESLAKTDYVNQLVEAMKDWQGGIPDIFFYVRILSVGPHN